MREKNDRLETLKMIISSQEMGSQEELLQALKTARKAFRPTPLCSLRKNHKELTSKYMCYE